MFERIRSSLANLISPAAPTQVRRFDAAAGGRRASGIGHFGRIVPEVSAANVNIRSRARHLATNNAWIQNGVGNIVTGLVGPGITPVSRHPDAETRKTLVSIFNDWADVADPEGLSDFWGIQCDVARALVIDGECFTHRMMTPEGPRLRVIPAEMVDEALTRQLDDGRYVIQGIEFGSDGQRLAYHIFPVRPIDQFGTFSPAVRIPASEISHIFRPLAAGQVRGVSWLASVVLPASDLDQLIDALLVGTKVAAMHAGFLVDQNGTAGVPYAGNEAGGILDSGIEPGTLKILPTGMDVRFNSPQQAKESAAFVKLNLRQLAAGLGIPTHMLDGDLSDANYSSLRAGLLPFRARCEQVQFGRIMPGFLRPLWREVITYHVLSGQLDAPDFEANIRDYLAHEWLPAKPMQVDPAKDVEADVAEIEAGLASRRMKVAERGWDMDALDAEIATDPRNQQKKDKPDAGTNDSP